jgi:DNA-binding FrmR family transcriptional regulator
MIGLASVLQAVFAGRGIYAHAADGIADARCGAVALMSVARMAAMVMSAAAPAGRLRRRGSCSGAGNLGGAAAAATGNRIAMVAHLALLAGLAPRTCRGYIGFMQKAIKDSCQKRLVRIEGQVRGLSKMVEEERYCIDIVTQISAVRAALRRVEEEVLRDHVSHCVERAIASGDKADQRKKIAELMDVIGRAER